MIRRLNPHAQKRGPESSTPEERGDILGRLLCISVALPFLDRCWRPAVRTPENWPIGSKLHSAVDNILFSFTENVHNHDT